MLVKLSDPEILTKQESEILITKLERDELSPAEKQVVAKVIRGYFYLADLVQESGVKLKRVREFIFGRSSKRARKATPKSQEPEESEPAVSTPTGTERALNEIPPPAKRTVKTCPPGKGHGRLAADDYPGAEVRHCSHPHLKPGDLCPDCGRGRLYQGKPKRQIQLQGHAPVSAICWQVEVLLCALCKKVFNARDTHQSKYDGSVKSSVTLCRYYMGLPFLRLEGFQRLIGVPLPDATQWDLVVQLFRDVFPVFCRLIDIAAQAPLIHHDDTGSRILTLIAENKTLPPGARYGIHSTGLVCEGEHRIILFFTGRAHSGENLGKLLDRRQPGLPRPLQMSDAASLNAPKNHPKGTIPCYCNAHGFRKFRDIRNLFPDPCETILQTLSTVYEHDRETKVRGHTAEERLQYHAKHSGPLLDGLKVWMEEQMTSRQVEPNSELGQAMNYMLSRWEGFTRFLVLPGVPLDNNLVERVLKRLIFQRKNSLFYASEYSAYVGSALTSLIMTAVEAGVNVFDYLNTLQANRFDVGRHPENWLPWNYRSPPEIQRAA